MRTRAKALSRARLDILRLEDRTVPSATATLVNGQLDIYADGAGDQIAVHLANGQYTISGIAQTFAASTVKAITISGGDGNDTISVGNEVTAPTIIFGGDGTNSITAGGGPTQIYGGMGTDYIAAGSGADTIYEGYHQANVIGAKAGDTVVQGSPARAAALGAMEQQILTLVNQQRAANGLPALTVNSQLTYAAELQSSNMASLSSVVGLSAAMAHQLDGSAVPLLKDRADYAGYQYSALGENIAYGYSSAADVMNAWMNSPAHRANILESMFTQIGISVATAPSGVLYFTEEFGSPVAGGGNLGSVPSLPIAPPTIPVPSALTPIGGATIQPAQHLNVVGTKGGTVAQVVGYDAATGRQVFTVNPFGGFTGGVKVATGDVDGDGYDDVIVAAWTGGGPEVRIFDGKTGNLYREFFAYGASFTGGVNVAVADIDGDGKADIITGAGPGGGPHVEVFSGADNHLIDNFFAYAANFTGGVSVAAGDVNGDGRADIVTGAGIGGGPHVEAFDGRSLQEFRSFFAFEPNFRGGVNVAVGDVDGDGKADIIVGAGAGGGPHVEVFSGADNHVEDSFFAFNGGFTGGVSVATTYVAGSNTLDLLIGGGAGQQSMVKVIQAGNLATVSSLTAFDPSFLGGVFVG
jgi:uncharacterized protein YkwD